MTQPSWLTEARKDPRTATPERRTAIADALRADLRPAEDRRLVRALFDAEVAAVLVAESPCLDALNLVAWLLTQVAEPADLWRMAEAKFANEATAAGFAGEHLLFQGVEETRAFLEASDHEARRRVHFYLFDDDGRCFIGPERLARWRRQASLAYGALFASAA